MNDMASTIIPKSDQLNADDLLSGPITVKITKVSIKPGQEQPIAVSYEGDHDKPYKPCKSMCRVMVSAWGADSSKYIGRYLTLYCDQKVKWGGMEVGGIRISHMSDIDTSMTMALTVTRANKKPYTVKPIIKSAAAQVPAQTHSVAQSQEPHPEPAPAADPTDDEIVTGIAFLVEKKEFAEAYDIARTGIKDDSRRTRVIARIKKAESEGAAKAAA
jgi:hypothetical protein